MRFISYYDDLTVTSQIGMRSGLFMLAKEDKTRSCIKMFIVLFIQPHCSVDFKFVGQWIWTRNLDFVFMKSC